MYKEFVLAWMDSYKRGLGVKAVAEKCDLTVSSASAKANQLRHKGVRLPIMPRSKETGLNVDSLNQLIESRI